MDNKKSTGKQTAGDIMRQMLKDDRTGIIAFREHGETKVKCAGAAGSHHDVAYLLAGIICQMSPTFNISPVSLAATVVDALNMFINFQHVNDDDNEN